MLTWCCALIDKANEDESGESVHGQSVSVCWSSASLAQEGQHWFGHCGTKLTDFH